MIYDKPKEIESVVRGNFINNFANNRPSLEN